MADRQKMHLNEINEAVARACGFHYQFVNDVCYIRIADGECRKFEPATNVATARHAAQKCGMVAVGENAAEICKSILRD